MEPVLAFVAAYVELRFVVGFAAQAKQLLCITGMFAFGAYEFGQCFGLVFADFDAFAVEPIVA